MMWGYGAGWFGSGMFMGMLVWALLIGLVVWALASLARRPFSQPHVESSALEILKRRYARGEISRAEYEQARKDLD